MSGHVRRADTADRILALAERLVQTRGFNGFSYADLASELGVTKASLHYHFPTKAELGYTLVERYSAAFTAALAAIDEGGGNSREKLLAYADLYTNVLRDDRICLCGMLAADYTTLPDRMKAAITHFFAVNEQWLAAVLEQGRAAGSLRFAGPPLEMARLLVASLEGAMLVARTFGDTSRFDAAAHRLLADLGADDQAVAFPD